MARIAVVDVAVLRRRSHLHPRVGGCLIEIAATLLGGAWTDHPDFIDPVLAAVARAVNDHTGTDQTRRRLLLLAPWLVTGGPVGGDGTAVHLGCLAGRAVLGRADAETSARVAASLVDLHVQPGGARWSRWWRRRRAIALVRLAAKILAKGLDGDAALFTLLVDAVNMTRELEGLPPTDVAMDTGNGLPETLPVLVEIRVPAGAESMYYHCTALTDRWPLPLRTAWHAREQELASVPVAAPTVRAGVAG